MGATRNVSLRSQDGYTLNFTGAVTGAGGITVTDGDVTFRGATNPNTFTVNGGVITIKREGNRLVSEAAGQTNELFAKKGSETELLTKEFDGRGEFVRDEHGRVSHLIYYEFGCEMGRAKKIR